MNSAAAVENPPPQHESTSRLYAAAPSAEDRTVRTLALATGLSGILYCLAETPEIYTQRTHFPPWWIAAAIALVIGSNATLAWSSRQSRTAIRRAALVSAISYPGLMLLAAPWLSYGAVGGSGTWIWRLTVIGAVAAPMIFARPWLLVLLPSWTAVEAAVNRYAIGGWTPAAVGEDYVRVLAAHAVFALFVSGALLAAATLDAAAESARQHAVATAAAGAREQERTRFAALVHDSVLSTLLDASRAGADPLVLRRQAESALAQLSVLATHEQAESLDAAAALELFGKAVWQVDWRLPYRDEARPGSERLRLPADAASAIAAALTEAVRNSVRHAARQTSVHRVATAETGADYVRVVLADDGPGFEPAAVPPGRLGIAVSIIGRMRQLPGGAATIESTPGRGTVVTLTWTASPSEAP